MKKGLKGLGLSLCAMMLLTGCSCKKDDSDNSVKANIKDGDSNILSGLTEGTANINLQALYDDLKSELGNEAAADKLLDLIASSVLNSGEDADEWTARYETKKEEKLLELTKDNTYFVDGEFNEELLYKTLKAQTYNITCPATGTKFGPTYKDSDKLFVYKYLLCDYSDYVDRALRLEILTELLNEKYVYDKVFKDKSNLLDTKKTRVVEYIAIDKSTEGSFDFINDAVKKIVDEGATLEEIGKLWEDRLIGDIEEDYKKINTKDDSTGKLMKEFTNGYQYDKSVGLRLKKLDVYSNNIYTKATINSDNKGSLPQVLLDRIMSENVLNQDADKTYKINDKYYLVSPLATGDIDANDIRITDTSNGSKYYLISVDVIGSSLLEDAAKKDVVYEAVKLLATNQSLVKDSINYYLEQNKNNISIHDEEIYVYLKTQYEDIFVD